MPDRHYTHGKLGEAVQKLAVHPGRIKERLTEAANLLVGVDENVFKGEGIYYDAPAYWNRIWSAITTAPRDPQRGVFGPSIDRLTESQASEIAQAIVSLDAMLD